MESSPSEAKKSNVWTYYNVHKCVDKQHAAQGRCDIEINTRAKLNHVFCQVVDAKHIIQHLDEEKPEGVENESVKQLAFADRVLLNKVCAVRYLFLCPTFFLVSRPWMASRRVVLCF